MRFLADNWWYILIFGLMFYTMSRGGGCCGGGHSSHMNHQDHNGENHIGGCCGGGNTNHMDCKEHSEGYIENSTNTSINTAKDPVCGMNVSKSDSISREINGKIYYFCSQNCANLFERKHAV